MTGSCVSENPCFSLDYSFNAEEVRALARFFRKNQDALPDALFAFASKIEREIYNSMSIDEAESFYS